MSHLGVWVQNGSDKRELLGNDASPATAPRLLEAGPTIFLFNRALCGASVSHTLIKSRHLIDTLCKVLRRWTKRTGLFYSPVDLMVHHLPSGWVRVCVCIHIWEYVCCVFCVVICTFPYLYHIFDNSNVNSYFDVISIFQWNSMALSLSFSFLCLYVNEVWGSAGGSFLAACSPMAATTAHANNPVLLLFTPNKPHTWNRLHHCKAWWVKMCMSFDKQGDVFYSTVYIQLY